MKQLILNYLIDPVVRRLMARFKYLQDNKDEQWKSLLVSRMQSVGSNFQLNGQTWKFIEPKKLIIGNNVHIGDNAFFNSAGGLIIGDNVHISRNVTIYTVNHNYQGAALPYDQQKRHKPVIIEANVWIGMNVSIAPGVRIGEGAIIGIGSVINQDVQAFAIIGASPGHQIKSRDRDHYFDLSENRRYGGVDGVPLTTAELHDFIPSYRENRLRPVVFVLSTGRSGSASIVEVMNQHPYCVAFHEDIRQLIRISTQIAHGVKARDAEQELEEILKTKIWQAGDGQLLVHSDQRLWNLIPFLADYFPNAKFVHLKRQPIPAVKSMLARNWYREREYPDHNDQDWAQYRLQGDKCNAMDKEEWNSLDPLRKCCWYWVYVNRRIEDQLRTLHHSKQLVLNLEDLETQMAQLVEFLELDSFQFNIRVTNKRMSVHDDNYSKLNNSQVEELIRSTIAFYEQHYKA